MLGTLITSTGISHFTLNLKIKPESVTQRDLFLEEILGLPSYRVHEPLKLDITQFAQTVSKCFLYAKTNCSNQAERSHLETLGFQVIETNVTLKQEIEYECKIESHQNGRYEIRLASSNDRAKVEEIASKSFTLDRFHQDPKIDNSSADEIKKQWAGNFFSGKRGDVTVVASKKNQPVAFLLLLFGQKENIIDLIAVDSKNRNNGLAKQMINFAKSINGFPKNLLVGTQASNIPSIRMYEKIGFKKINSQFVLHYHGPFKNVDS